MTSIRRMCCNDLLRLSSIHVDSKNVDTKYLSWYLSYIAVFPNNVHVAEAPGGHIMGYITSKVQGEETDKHGFITGIAVAKEYRKTLFVKNLVDKLESINEKIDKAYFMDVSVPATNSRVIDMYKRLGFELYRRVALGEAGQAWQMRKELSGLIELKEFMASVQRAAAAQQAAAAGKVEIVPYDDDGSSWLSDDGKVLHSDDDQKALPSQDVTTVPSGSDMTSVPSPDDMTSVPSADDMTNVPSAGDSAD